MSTIDLRGKKPIIKHSAEKARNVSAGVSNEIIWQIPESEYKPKDASWYWISLVVAAALVIFAIWQENFLFAIFVIIAFFTLNYLTNRFPAIWEIKMNEKGIFIGLPNSKNRKFYPMTDLECFDIQSKFEESGEEMEEEYKRLVLKFRTKLTPFLKINFYAKDEEKIKDFLSQFTTREELPKSLVDSLSELIGF